jgi:hypothetical protein
MIRNATVSLQCAEYLLPIFMIGAEQFLMDSALSTYELQKPIANLKEQLQFLKIAGA